MAPITMTKLEKKRGQIRIVGSILVLILVIASIKFFLANSNRKVTTHTQQAHAQAVEATKAPEPVQETTQEQKPAVEPVEQPQTINQAEAGVTYSPQDCEQYRPILTRNNWDVAVAMAVMKAESGCRYQAFNPEWHSGCQGSRGLFQIACVHADSTFDPEGNIQAAYRIYSSSGWRPWGAYNSGAYRRYL